MFCTHFLSIIRTELNITYFYSFLRLFLMTVIFSIYLHFNNSKTTRSNFNLIHQYFHKKSSALQFSNITNFTYCKVGLRLEKGKFVLP